MSCLYVVATPIGNLEDLSPRALRVMKEADLILAEDTRVTRRLLNAFSIKTPLESYHKHNEDSKAEQIISRMTVQPLNVALVTDAGTPGISDPGAQLVAAAHRAGIEVIAIPGPSAFVAALSKSGFGDKEFTFFGFLPRKRDELREKLRAMQGATPLAVLYESPHRIQSLLEAAGEVFPGSRVSLNRELSKLYEQTLNGTVEEVLALVRKEGNLQRGEFVLVLEVPPRAPLPPRTGEENSLEARLIALLAKGSTLREARAALMTYGLKKNAVYAAALNLKKLAADLLKGEG